MNCNIIDILIENLTVEEKVAQLFVVTPESLVKRDETVFECDQELTSILDAFFIGGILYFGRNLSDPEQVKEFLRKTQDVSYKRYGVPLFQCVDEEGGDVSRVANRSAFNVENIGYPSELAKSVDPHVVFEKGAYVGRYLLDLGFNVDFAPCADVLTNAKNTVIGNRSYGSDPDQVAKLSVAFAQGLLSSHVIPSFKHFPGHGDTEGDSHFGYAYTEKNIEKLFKCELIPFILGIENNIPMIMVGHISLPNVTGNNEPATLSHQIISELLRKQLGFEGIIITDSLKMKAISEAYTSDEAAIKVLEAGADMILRPIDFYDAYYGVINAVKTGRVTESRINQSLRRIFKTKLLYIN